MPPSFFSVEFHTRFFPALIRARMNPKNENQTVFVPHNYLQAGIALLLFTTLLIIGLASLTTMPLIGYGGSIIGGIGIITVFGYSIYIYRGIKPSYDTFLFGVFAVCVAFGITTGIFITAIGWHTPVLWRIAGGIAGLIAGYCAGIWGGLYMQKLGFVAFMLEGVAIPAIVGMVVVDMVLMVAG